MLIENENKSVFRVVHNEKSYAAVDGITEVPHEVAQHLLKFPEWHTVTNKVSDKTIKALEKAQTELEKSSEEIQPEDAGKQDDDNSKTENEKSSEDENQTKK